MATEYVDVTPDVDALLATFLREWRRADNALLDARRDADAAETDDEYDVAMARAARHASAAADAARMVLVIHGIDNGREH